MSQVPQTNPPAPTSSAPRHSTGIQEGPTQHGLTLPPRPKGPGHSRTGMLLGQSHHHDLLSRVQEPRKSACCSPRFLSFAFRHACVGQEVGQNLAPRPEGPHPPARPGLTHWQVQSSNRQQSGRRQQGGRNHTPGHSRNRTRECRGQKSPNREPGRGGSRKKTVLSSKIPEIKPGFSK